MLEIELLELPNFMHILVSAFKIDFILAYFLFILKGTAKDINVLLEEFCFLLVDELFFGHFVDEVYEFGDETSDFELNGEVGGLLILVIEHFFLTEIGEVIPEFSLHFADIKWLLELLIILVPLLKLVSALLYFVFELLPFPYAIILQSVFRLFPTLNQLLHFANDLLLLAQKVTIIPS